MSGKLPIACSLSDTELRTREATLLAQFRAEATMCEELDQGYRFRLSGNRPNLALVLELMTAERECCRFLTFDLNAAPNQGALSVSITGPTGTKEYLRSLLGLTQSRERS